MSSLCKVIFCLAIVLSIVGAAITVDSSVLFLDDTNFEEVIAAHSELAVFYCGARQNRFPLRLQKSPLHLRKVEFMPSSYRVRESQITCFLGIPEFGLFHSLLFWSQFMYTSQKSLKTCSAGRLNRRFINRYIRLV